MTPPELEEGDVRIQVPLLSAHVCTQRIDLLKMTLSLSSLTDQEKYNDVIASVKTWHDLDIMSFITIRAERAHGEPMSDKNKAVPDAGEGNRNKKRAGIDNVGCVSCVVGIHVNIYVKA